ncbi:MAG: ATP-binding cassette domain-containing protein [Clostridia bacterium]|nr:ATP-binding cassette domain-containing protein [Clostridia bacterium]
MSDSLLVTENLSKKYGNTLANDRIAVEIPKGKIVGFVGENGSGKTTFLRMITGLIRPTSGRFEFRTEDGACRVGAIVESPAFFPNMSAYDNLAFQARLCGTPKSKIPEILSRVGLESAGKKKAKHFSLGMKQRLGIAVALVSEPEFLILDEPTNGLDPQGIIELRKLLKALCSDGKMTLLISSHNLGELSQLADTYLFLHKGRIIESASASELLAHASKELRFRSETDASPAVEEILKNGYAERAVRDNGTYILYAPNRYPDLLKILSSLPVTDIETREESLETHYIRLMEENS